MEEKYLVCEDSLEGIFTGIYEAYALREEHSHIHVQIGEEDNLRLFAVYIRVEPETWKAARVAGTVRRRLGEDAYMDICQALSSADLEKGEAVYKTVVRGFRMKNGKQVMGMLADEYVRKTFELSRNAGNEIHHLKGFLRFLELENGILFARIGPKNNIITFLTPHFADRLPLSSFIIYDENRGIFAVHPSSKEWYLVTDKELETQNTWKYSDSEREYQELFTLFCSKIAIKERKNKKLQRGMLPLRFQEYMVEFRE